MADFFPVLPDDWEETRATLHAYAQGVGAVTRAHGISHPKWWHISLKVRPGGLATDPVPLPGGGSVGLTMDLASHVVWMRHSDGRQQSFSMNEGATGTEFADRLIGAVEGFGLTVGDYNREKFENDEDRSYDPEAAGRFWTAAVNAATVFERHRAAIGGEVGPVQLWPHGFDLSFEWFGTRIETYEENGELTEYPSQLNLGFYPGGRPYFYSNPWPFDADALTNKELPAGAEWHTDGWEGTILYYDLLAGKDDAAERLTEFAARVFEVASPTLIA